MTGKMLSFQFSDWKMLNFQFYDWKMLNCRWSDWKSDQFSVVWLENWHYFFGVFLLPYMQLFGT